MERRRRLIFNSKTFEAFKNVYPELPQIPGLVEQYRYLLALPPALEIAVSDGIYKVEVMEQIDGDGSVFHIVTNQEDYEYSLHQFLRYDRHEMPSEIKVLVIYYDLEIGVSTTLALKVNLEKCGDNRSINSKSPDKEVFIIQFHDFNNQTAL